MKLLKSARLYLWSAFYILVLGLIYAIYIYRENIIIWPLILVFVIFLILIAMFFSAKIKIKKKSLKINVDTWTKNEIRKIAKQRNIKINESTYAISFIYNDRIILETFDWQIFTPKLFSKRGKKIRTFSEVETYLKLATYTKNGKKKQ